MCVYQPHQPYGLVGVSRPALVGDYSDIRPFRRRLLPIQETLQAVSLCSCRFRLLLAYVVLRVPLRVVPCYKHFHERFNRFVAQVAGLYLRVLHVSL